MAGSGSGPWGVLLGSKVHDLTTPAESDDTPLVDAGALRLDLFQDLGDTLEGLWWSGESVEEPAVHVSTHIAIDICTIYLLSELLALLLGVFK